MSDNNSKLFDNESQFILFSGTNLDGNGSFRHLNDLFFILYLLVIKGIKKDKIYLSIDLSILDHLDKYTKGKKLQFNNKEYTFLEFFKNYIYEGNFIECSKFEKEFNRTENDLVFFASGHGAVKGLAIEHINNEQSTYSFLSSDYFEDIANDEYSTYLFLSQCKAGAFHHLDTRKNICIFGASDYQNSRSIPINIMFGGNINNLIFEKAIGINPFIFSLFLVLLYIDNGIIDNKKKNLINVFKYVASSTIDYISKLYESRKIIISKEILTSTDKPIEYKIDNLIIQQPYLLNKILASETYID